MLLAVANTRAKQQIRINDTTHAAPVTPCCWLAWGRCCARLCVCGCDPGEQITRGASWNQTSCDQSGLAGCFSPMRLRYCQRHNKVATAPMLDSAAIAPVGAVCADIHTLTFTHSHKKRAGLIMLAMAMPTRLAACLYSESSVTRQHPTRGAEEVNGCRGEEERHSATPSHAAALTTQHSGSLDNCSSQATYCALRKPQAHSRRAKRNCHRNCGL